MNINPIRILLADDDEDDRLFFKEALDGLKLLTTVTLVENGIELMENLLDPKSELPHVVFLDLNMPLKAGMECLYEIRNNDRLRSLSVAIYSTSSSDSDIEETFIKGANIFIKKPANLESLKFILNKVISINWQYYNSSLNKENFFLSI